MKRNFDAYHLTLYGFVREILVVCPNVSQLVLVSRSNFQEFKARIEGLGLNCKHCGFSRRLESIRRRQSPTQKYGVIHKFASVINPFFPADIWHLMERRNRKKWARGPMHLDFIRRLTTFNSVKAKQGNIFGVLAIGCLIVNLEPAFEMRG